MTQAPAGRPIGSVLIGSDGEAVQFRSRVRWFFGACIDDDAYMHDADDCAEADRDAAGLAPHRAQLVYAPLPASPAADRAASEPHPVTRECLLRLADRIQNAEGVGPLVIDASAADAIRQALAAPPADRAELAEAVAWLKGDECNVGPRSAKAIATVLAGLAARSTDAPSEPVSMPAAIRETLAQVELIRGGSVHWGGWSGAQQACDSLKHMIVSIGNAWASQCKTVNDLTEQCSRLAAQPAAPTSDERCSYCDARPSEPCPVDPHKCRAPVGAVGQAASTSSEPPEFPRGAIVNGHTLAERLEWMGFDCEAGKLALCSDWVEFRRCFEHLAEYVQSQVASTSAQGDRLVTMTLTVARGGDITSDVETHDNCYADVSRGLSACKAEIERVFMEQKTCPHYPKTPEQAKVKIPRATDRWQNIANVREAGENQYLAATQAPAAQPQVAKSDAIKAAIQSLTDAARRTNDAAERLQYSSAALLLDMASSGSTRAPAVPAASQRQQRLDDAMAKFDSAGPLPGMISAFETHFGQKWTDADWRNEASVWAAAWSRAVPATDARAEPVRQGWDVEDLLNRRATTAPAEAPSDELLKLSAECDRLNALLNTPELHDFSRAVTLEAAHQRERWGSDHDAGKTPADWFWLLGYLGGKALKAHSDGNTGKALHHAVSSAAACANWHAAIAGTHMGMRPGIDPVERGIEATDVASRHAAAAPWVCDGPTVASGAAPADQEGKS